MKRRVIALDAGGTKLLAGVVDEDGQVGFRSVLTWPADPTREQVLDCFSAAVAQARDQAPDAVAVGAGIPATLDGWTDAVGGCRHLPLAGFAFRAWLAEAAALPAFVDNDATLAMLAEHRSGAAQGVSDALLLTIGTGIGGGIVAGGRLLRGTHGAAGEPGHMTIDADGPPCPGDCPGRGCLEAYVSGPALAQMGYEYAALGPDYNLGRKLAENGELTAYDVVDAARVGDSGAYEAIQRMGTKLGIGLASLVNLLDPQAIVIGGGVGSYAGWMLIEPAERVVLERALQPGASDVSFDVAQHGEDAGMVGAGLLALAGGDV